MSSKPIKPKKPTYKELERHLQELRAQFPHAAAHAMKDIAGASNGHLTGSCVVLTLTALGGREIICPVAIRDGLSLATIDAIRADLRRSIDLALIAIPGAKS